jgi:hypothetical protein
VIGDVGAVFFEKKQLTTRGGVVLQARSISNEQPLVVQQKPTKPIP